MMHQGLFYTIYENTGKETILFLHTAMTNYHLYDQQFDYFKDDYQILVLDLYGHGQSEKKGNLLEVKNHINDILALEKINQVHAVGIALGSVILQDFANDYPEKILSLACFSSYDILNKNGNLQRFLDDHNNRILFKGERIVNSIAKTKEARKRLTELFEAHTQKSRLLLSNITRIRGNHPKKKRSYPVLIGIGEFEDEGLKTANQMWLETEPDCQWVEFKGAAQMINLDVPNEFNRVLHNFILRKT